MQRNTLLLSNAFKFLNLIDCQILVKITFQQQTWGPGTDKVRRSLIMGRKNNKHDRYGIPREILDTPIFFSMCYDGDIIGIYS